MSFLSVPLCYLSLLIHHFYNLLIKNGSSVIGKYANSKFWPVAFFFKQDSLPTDVVKMSLNYADNITYFRCAKLSHHYCDKILYKRDKHLDASRIITINVENLKTVYGDRYIGMVDSLTKRIFKNYKKFQIKIPARVTNLCK